MGLVARQTATDSLKSEVGEIDTRAPFQSVRAAVSLFGDVASSSEKHASQKPKLPSSERPSAKETQLHSTQKELNKLKEQLSSAETTRVQALAELEIARKTVMELTHKLNSINKSKEVALKTTEPSNSQAEQLGDCVAEDDSWKQGLDSSKEQNAAVVTQLDSAKQELRTIRKDCETSMETELCSSLQEAESKKSSDACGERADQLSKVIAEMQDSVLHVKVAAEETEKEPTSLIQEVDSEVDKNLIARLVGTSSQVGDVQKEIEAAKASDLECIENVTGDLDDTKAVLHQLAKEERSLHSSVESLKLELEAAKREHMELREKDAEAESIVGSLHVKLRKCKSELDAALGAETKAISSSEELVSALQRLTVESKNAKQEAEATKNQAGDKRTEAEATHATLIEAENTLWDALKEAEDARAAEARAVDLVNAISEKVNASRAPYTSELAPDIKISREEYEFLSRKVEESQKLADMKVAAAMAQVDAVKASESEAIQRLEAARKEVEDLQVATEEALKRAEMAEAAKKAIEGEMRRWREREQKKAAETASHVLVEAQMSEGPVPESPDRLDGIQKTAAKSLAPKKALLPSLSGIFNKKKSLAEGRSLSATKFPAAAGGERLV